MKKNYFLSFFIFFLTVASFGQGMEDFTNSNAGSSYATNSFTGNGGITWTYTASRDGNGDANGSSIDLPALMLRRSSDNSKITSGVISGGIANFSVKLYKGFTSGGNRQVELFVNGESKGTSDAFDDFNEHSFEVNDINVGGDITIEIRNITGKQIIIDDITWTAFAGAAQPVLNINSPAEGATVNSTRTNVDFTLQNFVVGNGTGDGYIEYYTQGPSGPPNPAVQKYDTDPISLTGLSAGNNSITIELLDGSGNSLTPAVTKTVNFTVVPPNQVANIAALRAGAQDEYFEITGEVFVTYVNTASSRNQMYIQDATAAILIDDAPNNLTTNYVAGDGITGLTGQLGVHNEALQLEPSQDAGAASSTGNSITPEVITLADLVANVTDYESELVTVNNVTFTDTGNFASFNNYDVTDGTASIFRTSFGNADYIGTAIPTNAVNITAIVGNFRGDAQITATSLADITLGVVKNNIEGYAVYPNPVKANFTLTTASADAKNISVYNILGAEVLRTKKIGNRVSVDITGLNKGIYILKVEENGKIATQKLIVE